MYNFKLNIYVPDLKCYEKYDFNDLIPFSCAFFN